MKLFVVAALLISVASLSLKATSLFNEDGSCTEVMQEMLNNINLYCSECHVKEVSPLLQDIYFQKDYEFYRHEGKPKHELTYEQAVKLLDDRYKYAQDIMPQKKEPCDVIMHGGVEPSMKKFFYSFQQLVEAGFEIKTVHIMAMNKENKETIESLINHEYKELFRDRKINIVLARVSIDVFADCLVQLKYQGSLNASYVLIANELVIDKSLKLAKDILEEKSTSLGAAVFPIKSWKEEKELYGYTAKNLGSEKEATIQWAYSHLNFEARNAHAVWLKWQQEHSFVFEPLLI